jgi:hypothetical protein
MSAINFGVINEDYPIAGQDNDTQGFRDNFGNIKTALSVTKDEINLLQANAMLKATVDGENDPVTNNMGGSTIKSGILTQMASGTIAGVIVADTISVNPSLAGFYYATVNADTTLQFVGSNFWPTWATAGTPACISVKVFIKAGTSGTTNRIITVDAGANTIKCDSSTSSSSLFTGSISGTTLTVSGIVSGSIVTGMYLSGGTIPTGTYISAYNSGIGGTGTYTINQSVTQGSTNIIGISAWTTSATTFTVNGTTKKYKLIEAFSYDGGLNVYVRFLGEF